MFYNSATGASVFFPAGGRKELKGRLMYAGETGYYWSSSVSPIFPNSMYNAWAQENRRDLVGNVSTSISAGHLIRCFRDN